MKDGYTISADANEARRLQRVREQDAVEKRLGLGTKKKLVETEDEHLRRLGLK